MTHGENVLLVDDPKEFAGPLCRCSALSIFERNSEPQRGNWWSRILVTLP